MAPARKAANAERPCPSRSDWMVYNPRNGKLVEGVPAELSRTLRRRYDLVDKARNANIIGKPPEPATCLHA